MIHPEGVTNSPVHSHRDEHLTQFLFSVLAPILPITLCLYCPSPRTGRGHAGNSGMLWPLGEVDEGSVFSVMGRVQINSMRW